MSTISRRTVVTSAAALPALAVPAIAADDDDDAELVRLGELLEPLEREAAALRAIEDQEHDGVDLSKLYDQLGDRMAGLVDEIIEHKANTLAGLTVQTRALRVDSPEHWDENMVLDPRLPVYLRSVCNVLGLALPPPCSFDREEGAVMTNVIRDPIITAIEQHRKAAAALTAACDLCADLEEAGKADDGPEAIAAHKAWEAAYRVAERAALRLLAIQPVTKGGVVALLAHYADIDANDPPPISDRAARRLDAPFGVIIARNAAAALLSIGCVS
jgi:hypothetical protein